jgi:hypothetical protein
MQVDESRKRSLYFLILATLRKYVLGTDNAQAASEIARNLRIEEQDKEWEVFSFLNNREIKTSIPKSNFKFYPTKNVSSYEIEPSAQNTLSAKLVVRNLFDIAGINNTNLTTSNEKTKLNSRHLKMSIPILQVPILFIFTYFQWTGFISSGVFSVFRVFFGIFVFFSFISLRKFREKLLKYLALFLLFIFTSYFAQISLEPAFALIFVSQLLVIDVIYQLTKKSSINKIFLFLSTGTALMFMLQDLMQLERNQVALILVLISIYFLNLSKYLGSRGKRRQTSLVLGLVLFMTGMIVLLSNSISNIYAFIFVIVVASLMLLKSRSDAAIKIFLGLGWVASN